jgi:hypothetical protein
MVVRASLHPTMQGPCRIAMVPAAGAARAACLKLVRGGAGMHQAGAADACVHGDVLAVACVARVANRPVCCRTAGFMRIPGELCMSNIFDIRGGPF